VAQEHDRIEGMLSNRTGKIFRRPSRSVLIDNAVNHWNAFRLESGALITWTPRDSTGRSPADTLIVHRPESAKQIDWNSPYAIPVEPEVFEMIFNDMIVSLEHRDRIYVLDKAIGADPAYSLPVCTILDNPLGGLFVDNMFREPTVEHSRSCFADRPFHLLVNQYGKLDPERYRGILRTLPDGSPSRKVVIMDFERRIGIVYGFSYMGAIKKLMFSVMNYYLPEEGVLPLHCSANEELDGDLAVFLGMSGTGKTTLSSDPDRALIGDDEHGWSERGIANFENGCYAKLYKLDPRKEPEVYNAVFHPDHYLSHGALVENLMVYPTGDYDFDDDRFTQNSRASYPLRYLSNVKESSSGGHPRTMVFLTADAYGVLPPIARLTPEQAMFWFMMGYTSKLAGTETGVVEPQVMFSRFFGAPFMPRHPGAYTELLGKNLARHGTRVFLVNTGWSGGPYGIGERMDITLTRAMVQAALSGGLDAVPYQTDEVFKLDIPGECPGVPRDVLNPITTWTDRDSYFAGATKLVREFRNHFEREFAGKVPREVAAHCPDMP
jgi:phosphoenolpyruvate carboxykinase (ATP)